LGVPPELSKRSRKNAKSAKNAKDAKREDSTLLLGVLGVL